MSAVTLRRGIAYLHAILRGMRIGFPAWVLCRIISANLVLTNTDRLDVRGMRGTFRPDSTFSPPLSSFYSPICKKEGSPRVGLEDSPHSPHVCSTMHISTRASF